VLEEVEKAGFPIICQVLERGEGGGGILTGLSDLGLMIAVSRLALLRFPKPENMSEKSPPRLNPKSLLSSFGGVAVLA